MDPGNNLSSNENAPSPRYDGDTSVGPALQNRLAYILRTPSPMFCPDNNGGDVRSSGSNISGLECPPNSRHISGANSVLFLSPRSPGTLESPILNTQELNPNLSAETDADEHDPASGSQAKSDDGLGDFVVPDDYDSEAEAASTTKLQRGRSSGLVNKHKIGKTVNASPTKTSPIKQTLSGKKKGSRNMLKELLSHNEDVVKRTREDISAPLFDTSFVKLTRSNSRALHSAKQDKPSSPRKTYNEKELMEEQMQKVRGQKKYYPTDEQTPRMSSRPSVSQPGEATTSPYVEAQMTAVQPRKTSGREAADAVIAMQAESALDKWDEWDTRKGQIINLLNKTQYTVSATAHNPLALTLSKTPAYLPEGGIPDGFNLSMEKGLHVFSPTANVFEDFPTFLEAVEEIAGREHGVIKVIVPKECVKSRNKPSYSSVGQGGLMALKTCTPTLELHRNRATTTAVYDVLMPHTAGLAAVAWRKAIQVEQAKLQKHLGALGVVVEDVWKEAHQLDIYDEKAMIKDNEKCANDIFYAPDIAATDDLRDTLRCGNPELKAYLGNTLLKPQWVKAGVNTSAFQVSSTDSSVFGMRIVDLGAYLLNYLHDGAPQVWTIVRPTEHKKLEETLHGFQQPLKTGAKGTGIAIPRPFLPPACDNFLKHKPLYVPEETLKSYDIKYTKIAQYLGEMVIVFPFAYHQAYNTGANIAESMAYASNRWEIFPAKKLLKQCNKECSLGTVSPEFDLDSISSSPPDQSTGSPGSSGSSIRSPRFPLLSSRATSAPEEKHPDKRQRPEKEKHSWEGMDGIFDEVRSGQNPAPPTDDSMQSSKRARTKRTHQDTGSDNAAEVESLKQKIQQLVAENSELKKSA